MGKQFDDIYHFASADRKKTEFCWTLGFWILTGRELVQQATPEVMGKPTSQQLKCPEVEEVLYTPLPNIYQQPLDPLCE